jgi:hypothetical protein
MAGCCEEPILLEKVLDWKTFKTNLNEQKDEVKRRLLTALISFLVNFSSFA